MSNLFQKNAHGFERVARIVVGLALLSLVFVGPKTLWGLLGLLFTGAIGFCPAYTLLGISTRRKGAAS
jgi:Na+/proline symporter